MADIEAPEHGSGEATAEGGVTAPLQLLADAEFRRVWIAGAAAGIMRWLDVLAVSVYVLQITNSAFMVAMTLFVRVIPMFLFGAAAGAFAGMVDRRKLLIGGLVFLSAVYGFLSWLAWTGSITVWHLAIIVFLSGLYWTFELPIRRTMIAEIAGIERIAATMGLESSTTNLTRMMGPFLGGFILEVIGLHGTLFLGACLYLVAAFALVRVRYATGPIFDERPPIIANLVEGFRFVFAHRAVTATLAVTMIVNLFGFSYVSMLPVIAREEMGLSPFPTGILASAEGCGAFFGALLIAFFARPRRFHQIYACGSALFLACILAFALTHMFGPGLVVLGIGGFGMAGFASMQSALIIGNAPPEMRNRLMGVLAMCIGVGPLGILIVGTLAQFLGAAVGVTITSVTGLVCLAFSVVVWPEMRTARNP